MPRDYPIKPGAARRETGEIVLHEKAADDLRFIRSAMERASSFTAVPGWGGATMGATAVAASWLAAIQPTSARWLGVWVAELVAAVLIGAATMTLKARRVGQPLAGAVGRRFAMSFAAPLMAGAVLTIALYLQGPFALLPALWLLCYGAAVIAGGTMSVLPVPLMGCGLMLLGAVAAVLPRFGDIWMAIGFGVLQVGVGIWIARRHGG
jgi:hypothetical protein